MNHRFKIVVAAVRTRLAECWTPERNAMASRLWFWIRVADGFRKAADFCMRYHEQLEGLLEHIARIFFG